MDDNDIKSMSDDELLNSLGIRKLDQTLVGETASATVPSSDMASWLKEQLQGLDIGPIIGGSAGAAVGSIPPVLAATGGWGPYVGGSTGAMLGRTVQDAITQSPDMGRMLLEGVLGGVGPIPGKLGMGIGSLIKGTTSMYSHPGTTQAQVFKALLAAILAGGGGAWGSYHTGGNPAASALSGLAGAALPYGYQFGKAMTKMGAWNPFASGLSTGIAVDPIDVMSMLKDAGSEAYSGLSNVYNYMLGPGEQPMIPGGGGR